MQLEDASQQEDSRKQNTSKQLHCAVPLQTQVTESGEEKGRWIFKKIIQVPIQVRLLKKKWDSPFLWHAHDLSEQGRNAPKLIHVDGYQHQHGVTHHHRPERLQNPTPNIVPDLREENMKSKQRKKNICFLEGKDIIQSFCVFWGAGACK